jgi:uncharacterized short protein YbdD (DUF466 family)
MRPRHLIEGLRMRLESLRRSTAWFDSYSRYLAHHDAHHPEQPTLDRRAFYLQRQARKWSGINRCC